MAGARPWRDVLAAVAAVPEVAELGPTLAPAWTATLATPAIICTPVRRYVVRASDVRWELALQVVVPLQADDDEPLHELLELALAVLPPGILQGETVYGQDDRAGGTYVVSTTTLTA